MFTISELIAAAQHYRASDLHLSAGVPPKLRISGDLADYGNERLTGADCEAYARELAADAFPRLEEEGELDLAATYGQNRVRINIFRQQGCYAAAIRLLSDTIPVLSNLGLPPAVFNFPAIHSGIVLVTGETGSGKSTTLAALLDAINRSRTDHIITLEDPIEYIYTPDKCLINQREIGRDSKSYANALRAVLREDPDVILIGEMRDLVSIETALTAAETGHLVFSTLHTNSAADSIDRMVNVFPEGQQPQIRMQLSRTLHAVLSQQLIKRSEGGRVVACELMVVNPAIRNLIREGKTPQIANTMATSAHEGSITMDNSLLQLCRDRVITPEVALAAANDSEYLRKALHI